MNYSFLDLAYEVLKQSSKPLTYQEVWQVGRDKGLASKIQTSGKTPWQTLGAQLYVEVRDNEASKFIKVGKRPARFFLRERASEVSPDTVTRIEKEEGKRTGAAVDAWRVDGRQKPRISGPARKEVV